MPTTSAAAAVRLARPGFLPPRSLLGFGAAAVAVILIAWLSWQSLDSRAASRDRYDRAALVQKHVDEVLAALKDMETGQRGYLLTGEERYLLPYNLAGGVLSSNAERVIELTRDDPAQQERATTLQQLAATKVDELAETIALRRSGDAEGAMRMVLSDQGRTVMQQIRTLVDQMTAAQNETLRTQEMAALQGARMSYFVSLGGSGVLLFLILLGMVLSSREYRASQAQLWLRTGQTGLAERVQGDQSVDVLADNALGFLSAFLEAPLAAVHAIDGGVPRHVASLGREAAAGREATSTPLVAEASRAKAPRVVRDVPADYFTVSSGLGTSKVRELLLVPARVDGVNFAVIELGFFRTLRDEDLEYAQRISETLGIAVRGAMDRTRLEQLLEETQRQAEELQTQQEELRVSNEELEEQSRLARQAQVMLEAQQTELEQSNSQLEEQTQMLEAQKLELTDAQSALEARAEDLERANRYKSEFLANMSHELRTPLNSTLILSKLLSDNKHGHLSEEEVNFARIITSAGNDLLTLINDILDLSKIEAGKLELLVEPTPVAPMVEEITNAFAPAIAEKGLGFDIDIAPRTPPQVHTDRQRLAQILRNLLSNAMKFTSQGRITVQVRGDGDDRIAFDVTDTGIGLPAHQQDVIFEAFRQADGSTHRRYGGTGLGLSISRDLAHRLGGDLTVRSEEGKGATFTLVLPVHLAEPLPSRPLPPTPAIAAAPAATPRPHPVHTPAPSAPAPDADLANDANDSRRLILAVEDDPLFAAILRDMVNEMGFRCIVAHTGADALAMARKHTPSAILLDVVLPDLSGMGVLEQLKRDSRTRHIPVHMVSVSDFSREAKELGAVGYALKPVQREHLVEALRRLESKFSQAERRVLVVEDDARQRASMIALLRTDQTRIVAVQNAAEALQQLSDTTFDCMVLDLNLPDLSGYQLLERMSQREDVAFPPVIVYTGRSLSRDEEQRLMRYSDSIILKGARSPERLLDEVTLFLHQVETNLPPEAQKMLRSVRERDDVLDGRRVLVVEDDVRNVFALTSVLEPRGMVVEVARNGREALDRMSGQDPAAPYDIVLMDIMMPEMDGLTAMREIRKRPEWTRVPIIALTAKAMKDDREQCMAAGANDYIAKPLDVDRLLSLVRVWMPKQARP